MKPETRTIELGDVTYRLRSNDMAYLAEFERQTGLNALRPVELTAGVVVAVIWAGIVSECAARDEDPPISRRQMASMIDTDAKIEAAFGIAVELLGLNLPPAKEDASATADPPAAPASRSRSRGATSSRRSTSESATANSGG